ncbi:hypothetical protein pb186bvf_006590 [Paramecium bursaria]
MKKMMSGVNGCDQQTPKKIEKQEQQGQNVIKQVIKEDNLKENDVWCQRAYSEKLLKNSKSIIIKLKCHQTSNQRVEPKRSELIEQKMTYHNEQYIPFFKREYFFKYNVKDLIQYKNMNKNDFFNHTNMDNEFNQLI